MKLSLALIELGYKEFVCGDTFESIQWIIEPEKKPTKKQVEDMLKQIDQILENRKIEQKELKISAYKKLGLSDEEISAIL